MKKSFALLSVRVVFIVSCVLLFASRTAIAATGDMTIFQLPDKTHFDGPDMPMVGPDGNIWFVEYGTNKIGFITPHAPFNIREFPLPKTSTGVVQMTGGGDGNIWFTSGGSVGYQVGGNPGTIGRILTQPPYTVTEFPPPFRTYTTDRVASGPDGNIWFTAEPGQGSPSGSVTKLFSISPYGDNKMVEYSEPAVVNYGWLLPGHDDDFWFYGSAGKAARPVIGSFRVADPAHAEFYRIPGGGGPSYIGPTDMLWGYDGNIWFPDWFSISQFLPETREIAQIAVYPQAVGATFASDGNLWFTVENFATTSINRMRPTYPYTITQYPIKTPPGVSAIGPNHIVAGPDGSLWATMIETKNGGAIIRIEINP